MEKKKDIQLEPADEGRVEEAMALLREMEAVDRARGYDRVVRPVLERWRRERRWRWWRVAAMFVLPLTVGTLAWWALGREDEGVKVASVPPGKAGAVLVLPRGDQVMLGENAVDLGAGMRNEDFTLNYRGTGTASKEMTGETREDANGVMAGEMHLLRIPRGGEYTLVLADGTTVYLNAETELRYPARFWGKERKVYLKGEAYFDVMPDAEMPFVVETGEMDVRVYGTEFNVTAYEGESTRTVLVEGKVGVRLEEGGEEVQLRPGQMAEREGEGIAVREVETYVYTAWKDGKFVFEEENIERIMDRLSRWYDINVFYANEEVKKELFNGVITRFTEVGDILQVIEQTATVEFELKGNTVIVK